MTFEGFSFDQRISAGIKACGYVTPTPIQTRAIPEVLAGHDVLGLAQTGTGKTAAFALPILQRLLASGARSQGPVRTLVLAPTRELALQIHENFIQLGRQTGMRSAAIFGGVGVHPQIKAARRATVVVACPGRLLDLMNQGAVDLGSVDTLVLDEADRMLDMGFMPDIKRILSKLPRDRQNLLFSATMPDDIRKFADWILHNPVTVQVSNTATAEGVSHAFYPVMQHLKFDLLERILDTTKHDSVLVFTRTKHRAKTVARKLSARGHSATFLQGNMSQNQRQRALDGFRSGNYKVMVATDIAARGIDCERITHVVNFDAPDTAETYTHRIGRTGRAGRTGTALCLVTRDDKHIMRAMERAAKTRIKMHTVEGFDYDQPAPKQGGNDQKALDRPDRPKRPARARSSRPSRPGGQGGGQGGGRGKSRRRSAASA